MFNREVAVAIAAACGAATLYGLSNVFQQEEAEKLETRATMRLGLLATLARQRRWWIGMVSDVGGYALEAVALGAGSLMLVEPLLAMSLPLSLLLNHALRRRRVDRLGWVATALLATGVVCFLLQMSPNGGVQVAARHDWVVAIVPILFGVAGCLALARTASAAHRAAFLGLAAGAAFAVSAVLTKAFVHYLADGVFGWVNHWEPYALAASSIGGLICSQSAFQTGALATAVGAEQMMQPLLGVLLGAGILHEETSASGMFGYALVLSSMIAMAVGVVGVSRAEYGTGSVRSATSSRSHETQSPLSAKTLMPD